MSFRVLLVDDESSIRISLSKRIEDSGLPVKVVGQAKNGVDALEWLRQHYADLVFTDIRMPRMDGIQLLERLNMEYPVLMNVVVSSHDDFQYARQCIDLNVVDYLLKPIRSDRLHAILLKAIEQLTAKRRQTAAGLFIDQWSSLQPSLSAWVSAVKARALPDEVLTHTLKRLGQASRYPHLYTTLAEQWLELIAKELKCLPERSTEAKAEPQQVVGHAVLWEEVKAEKEAAALRMLRSGFDRLLLSTEQPGNSNHAQIVEDIRSYLKKNYTQKISIEAVAEHVGLSKSYISILFRQSAGVTILGYLVKLRMEQAKYLLRTTTLKGYEIANQVGYEDYAYFSNLFKDYTGYKPNEFRKEGG